MKKGGCVDFGRTVFLSLILVSLVACQSNVAGSKTATYAVQTLAVAAKLAVLDDDLDRLHKEADFAYMEPADRETMHAVIQSVYDGRATLREEVKRAKAGDLLYMILAADQVQRLLVMRDQIAVGVATARAYLPKMDQAQQERFKEVQARLIATDKSLQVMKQLPGERNSTETVTNLITLAAAVARARQ